MSTIDHTPLKHLYNRMAASHDGFIEELRHFREKGIGLSCSKLEAILDREEEATSSLKSAVVHLDGFEEAFAPKKH
jgi:hypothetical protein